MTETTHIADERAAGNGRTDLHARLVREWQVILSFTLSKTLWDVIERTARQQQLRSYRIFSVHGHPCNQRALHATVTPLSSYTKSAQNIQKKQVYNTSKNHIIIWGCLHNHQLPRHQQILVAFCGIMTDDEHQARPRERKRRTQRRVCSTRDHTFLPLHSKNEWPYIMSGRPWISFR
jgi:hypothetical protein